MIKIGLYGKNGHQIQTELAKRTDARLTAIAEMTRGDLPQGFPQTDSVREYVSLEDLLDDPEVELISLCSPRRADQARHAIQALEAGKHVLAEKPCALTEADLDAIIEAAKRTGRVFHEMAGTAFGQPYFAMH
ncbi:MAG: Gfo/Idh/MocA family protein, partial [Puniceicoccales bacterium]